LVVNIIICPYYQKIVSFAVLYSISKMSIEEILTAYSTSPQITGMERVLESNPKAILKGLIGSQDAFVAAAFFNNNKKTQLFILSDKDEASYFHNNLQNILKNKEILFFPDSYKRIGQINEINASQHNQRTETIHQIMQFPGIQNLVCTYPTALFEKVVSKKTITENAIRIKLKQKIDIDKLIETLVNNGFEHSEFVFEPGQLSVRGGIIDIYSYAFEHPYRVELFDDEVESIRIFDPGTQLSLRKIESISIVPDLHNNTKNIEMVSLFSLLPSDSIIWVRGVHNLIDTVQLCWEKTNEFCDKNKDFDIHLNDFATIQSVKEDLVSFKGVEF
jgi:transcription-repair coupling factor (superfamily II helicase)